MDKKLLITPKTKVGEILNEYPELEDVLIEITPVFNKLKNPVLRKTIAKVTTLQQAALVGNVSVDYVVNRLRAAAGLSQLDSMDDNSEVHANQPAWYDKDKITQSFDAREVIASGGHPLDKVLIDLNKLENDMIYELITPFLPAPLLDRVKAKGYDVWSRQDGEVFNNYFRKA